MLPAGNAKLLDVAGLDCRRENLLPFYRFPNLSQSPRIEHAIFTRLGGVSSPPFASLNTSYDTGDHSSRVRENLRRIRATLNSSLLLYARQSHGSNILVLRDYPSLDPTLDYPFSRVDGFITNLPGLFLMVKVADCQPIFLHDPGKQVVAVIHAGWRGSVQNITGKAVALMELYFRCRPRDIVAGIGPSLGPCCAEFRHWRRQLPASFQRFRLNEHYFDFWAISRHQLQEAGVPGKNIAVANVCTRCHPEIFYSYRGEGRTGRFAAAIGIRE